MLKEFFIVGAGSFFGGGLRYLVGRIPAPVFESSTLPLGTFIVNVLGCFIIGFLSGLNWNHGIMNDNTKLLLTTGFCGGFTTFSTFINENASFFKDGNFTMMVVYTLASITLGFAFLMLGNYLSKQV